MCNDVNARFLRANLQHIWPIMFIATESFLQITWYILNWLMTASKDAPGLDKDQQRFNWRWNHTDNTHVVLCLPCILVTVQNSSTDTAAAAVRFVGAFSFCLISLSLTLSFSQSAGRTCCYVHFLNYFLTDIPFFHTSWTEIKTKLYTVVHSNFLLEKKCCFKYCIVKKGFYRILLNNLKRGVVLSGSLSVDQSFQSVFSVPFNRSTEGESNLF